MRPILLWPLFLSTLALAQSSPFCSDTELARLRASPSQPSVINLIHAADLALKAPPLSVSDLKTHTYKSISRYYWPDPRDPNAPWIRKDGVSNETRESIAPDSKSLGQTAYRIKTLSFAYSITHDPKYGAKAAALTRAWFLDPSTHMNPNLNFSQGIPHKSEGQPSGIIEGNDLISILDSLPLLQGSNAWTPTDSRGLQQWMTQYKSWLLTSDLGKKEGASPNNHHSWYLAQLASIQNNLGDQKSVSESLRSAQSLINQQIKADGRQEEELKRTRPLQYSFYNLDALSKLAMLKPVGAPNLWPSLKTAIDFLLPCLKRGGACPFPAEAIAGASANSPGVDPFNLDVALRVLKRANQALANHPYSGLIGELEAKTPKLDVFTLCLSNSSQENAPRNPNPILSHSIAP